MSLDQLQIELDAIDAALTSVGKLALAGTHTSDRRMTLMKASIIKLQVQFDKAISVMKRTADKDHLLLPQERALLKTALRFAENAATLSDSQRHVATQELWLNLFKARFSAPGEGIDASFDLDGLVDLAVRQTNLSKTEKALTDNLMALQKRHAQVRAQFETLGISAANKLAASTFASRLGPTPEQAFRSPELKALEHLALDAFAPIGDGRANRYSKRLTTQKAKHISTTKTLLRGCRDTILNAMKNGDLVNEPGLPPLPKATAAANSRFRQTLQDLDRLEAAAEKSCNELRQSLPPLSFDAPLG